MFDVFNDEICNFFPFDPYKIQLNFMRIFYEILKNSNIKINENVKLVYDIIKQSEKLQIMLKDEKNINVNMYDDNNTITKNEYTNENLEEDNNSYEHIICEMKTGSGKSLTLLTSIIYWFFKHKFDLFLLKERVEIKKNEPEWIKESVIEKIIEKYKYILENENKKKEIDKSILNKYFSFTDDKINLHENIVIEKKKVQLEKSEFSENFLLEDKNEDILSDCYIEEMNKKQIFICSRTQSQLNQYFHELKKIEKKIKNEIFVNMIIIGSRKHLCINENFLRRYKSVNELNDCCKSSYCKYKEIFNEKMIQINKKKKKKKKIFYNSSSSSDNTECEDNNKINNYNLVTKLINTKNVNMNEIKDICRNEKIEICPYYLCKENIKNADIVLLPYICILNENIRNNLKINIKNNIVIFDESQNIIENINNCNSTYIENHQILFCKLILKEYIQKYKNVLTNNNIIMIKQIIIYCDLLLDSFKLVDENVMNINKFTVLSKLDALNLNNILNFLNNSLFCRKIKIFAETYMNRNYKNYANDSIIKTSSIYLLSEFTNKLIKSNKYDYIYLNNNDDNIEYNDMISRNEHLKKNTTSENKDIKIHEVEVVDNKKRSKLNEMYETDAKKKKKNERNNDNNEKEEILLKDEQLDNFKKFFEELFVIKKKDLFRKIEIISVSSCNNFQLITKNCSNVILIGGTLYPIEEFLLLFLNEKKNKIKIYSSDYIFNEENIFSRIISTNLITYECIDNTYKNRFDKKHLLNLSIQIYILTLYVNYGNIIFFPSYNFLNIFMCFLNKEGNYVLNEMKKKKYVFFEKKNNNDILKDYIDHIVMIKKQDEKMRIKNGCILFCVMNAKLSEGINFYNEFCRNILIVGIPFFKYEKPNESNKFMLDKNSLILNYYKTYSTEVINDEKSSVKNPHRKSILMYEDINKMCNTYQLKYAMKIINQCIGRSLRHINDFSSFFFLDFRFTKKEIFDNFPSFIKKHLSNITNFSAVEKKNKFLEVKEKFYKIFIDFKNYYNKNFSNLQFSELNEVQLKNFICDLYCLKDFHEKMKNI
ncbi:DEAD box helicase, putative [Plasmodium gallinaceum]|uniref:DEAD box helicase, putative n=1 Tax=Plasmodium gallinaceum TaxID=5849 RepID=A0A1J1GR01_PLAGA|nr:DEAD box helicase, putative [Plasmodium gallinaceum]CRG94967.1 DEAD box helicase, putative [Plasmodium gallinaceum]